MKSVGETKAIRIYPMPDKTCKVMWEIHPPKSCQKKFGVKDWASDKSELANKIKKISDFILSHKNE
jgi:hypothetical protein